MKNYILIIFSIIFAINTAYSAEITEKIYKKKDASGDTLLVDAVSGVTYCNGGRPAVTVSQHDEYVIQYVSTCLSHKEVDELINALQKAKKRFK
ncbi:hypothetical protein KW477_07130 [Vibrio fluvialis]|nr:hypothetical protein [Vibrio fluvialis]